MSELVIAQVDRDAAEALWSAEGVGQSMPDCWPEAFARHRIAAEKAIVDWLRETWPPERYGEDWPVTSAINAIENCEHLKGQAHD